jgi:hypothetical protein
VRRRHCAELRSAAIAAWQVFTTLSIRGQSWREAQLGKDEGKYGFRQWQTQLTLSSPGKYSLLTRCTNSKGVAQPDTPNWNPAGFMRNVVEAIDVTAV